jgi:hypothetical protein
MGWYFLWGPFRGGIFFGVRSEGIFLCLLGVFQKRIVCGGAGPAESMAGETSSRPTIAGFEISTRATPGISATTPIKFQSKDQTIFRELRNDGMKITAV